MKKLMYVIFACVAATLATASARAEDGVDGVTVRPMQDKAKVEGCKIAIPAEYEVTVGDLIELDYTYPVIPVAIPNNVNYKQTLTEAVGKSPLGFRRVTTPKMVGTGTIAFYFDAKKVGEETVTLIIDEAEYAYKFKVVASTEEAKTVSIPIANETGEDIFFFVNGLHGSTKKIALQKERVVVISFYNDKNERTLAAFAKDGNKVLSLFKFTPGEFCLLIEKDQTKEKTVAVGSKKPTETYEGEAH
jgi:hypothetical protein